jgi:hypothetical protein
MIWHGSTGFRNEVNMYSEIKPNTAEKQELARRALVQTLKDNPKLSMQACWDKTKGANPQLFGDLQAADWMEEDRAEEQEKAESTASAENASQGQSILCVGGFFNPLS